MKLLFFILSIFSCLFCFQLVFATHNRAGEIYYKNAPIAGQPYRYEFTIITYTKIGGDSDDADRDTLSISYGDGAFGNSPRVNGPNNKGEVISGSNIKYNKYLSYHSYSGPFNYVVSVQDPNRIDDIINIQYGQSVDVPFYLQDTIFFRDPQFFGYNSSPILLQPPIDYGNVNYIFVHNPNAYDADGDSLYFELIPPKADAYNNVPLYQFPDNILPGNDNQITLNPYTGEFIWNAPQQEGIYNIAFLIREYRNGVQIGNMIRDMQIIVKNLNNKPPVVNELKDTCILIGQKLNITVHASDPDVPKQLVTISAFGGPLEVNDSPATFTSVAAIGATTGNFTWQTNCNHIFSTPYTVVFKAEDNFSVGATPFPLTDLETWLITVIPPPPTNLLAAVNGNEIVLTWEQHECQNSPKFMGFSIWRSIGCDSTTFSPCQVGLNGTNYIKIADNLKTNSYTDVSALRGLKYSYRVVAQFADSFTASNPAVPINTSESMPSENACIELPQNVPVITNVSILSTQNTNGSIYVAWSKPKAKALDTLVNLPPYKYELLRADNLNGNNYSLLQTYTYNFFKLANDTIYTDNSAILNTQNLPYNYIVNFYANNILVGSANNASSVFLSLSPSDNQLQLNWNFSVPWLNYQYTIFKENDSGSFDSIATTTNTFYIDTDLKNGTQYCYYVKAIGTYGSDNIISPLINLSQIACDAPRDTVPPCPPTLSVSNDCGNEINQWTSENFKNNLLWQNNALACAFDVIFYKIYYKSPTSSNYELLDSTTFNTYDHFLKNSLSGCYVVSAIDSFYNESIYSNEVCIENCTDYELPNVFTPNNDNKNDELVPRKNLFVNSINMKIYNQWGVLVFETKNPEIKWNGVDKTSGKKVSDGVYHYLCEVIELNSNGIKQINKTLSGYIHVISGN